ncbi:hypothetical protein [Streptomyces bluensis]|uniref:Uncharacterized protein n=1 Tax=Streptomyces bluensis TaxID=33897 RepID=A0ABW6UUD3_9ACTN
MDLSTARARIHAMFTAPDDAAVDELDRRIDDLITASKQLADPYVSSTLPPRDAICTRPDCGHSGADHHHGDTKCWAHLPRTRGQFGVMSPITICPCPGFQPS